MSEKDPKTFYPLTDTQLAFLRGKVTQDALTLGEIQQLRIEYEELTRYVGVKNGQAQYEITDKGRAVALLFDYHEALKILMEIIKPYLNLSPVCE